MNRRLVLPGLVLAALALAACSTTTGGTANPAPSSPQDSASSADGGGGNGAPKVSSPLDPGKLKSDPCSVLSPAQRSTLGLEDGTPRSTNAGTSCAWVYQGDETRSSRIDIAADPNTDGLAGIYDLYAKGGKDQYEYWEPTDVSGYPAVYAATKDFRAQGQCKLLVGVTDTQAVQVFTQIGNGPGATDPCPYAQKAAEAMIQTLKEG
ncbi:DUF3558 domain-containing protein [Amycolatopsis australiensis]|uniref:DUF3558 domain-containing protein n=1 Tax=Amycolatopsis australiensis TaxID=546364 RepID=A0A1K1Q2V1_9PSEU|nr:DUF3558 domain-containing protein [Amycolatopsis australiensis]SFW54069.1 Protein of unknown function [Amycolatopsis australiensis]